MNAPETSSERIARIDAERSSSTAVQSVDIPIEADATKPPVVAEKPRSPSSAFIPKKGFGWNPLREFPRNAPCFCGSKKKFKKCCIDKLATCLPEAEIPTAVEFMRRVREIERVSKGTA